VCWRYAPEPGREKPRKKPYKPRGWGEASVSDPDTWGTYAEAREAVGRHLHEGVGFVLDAGDPYVGVDLDGCRHPETGGLEGWATEIVELLDSYTEVSPSGTGVHVVARGALPPGGRRRAGRVEMYDAGRYLAWTGDVLGGRGELADRGAELGELYRRVFGEPEPDPPAGAPPHPPASTHAPAGGEVGDGELLARALADPRTAALWGGDTSGYGGNHSDADLALCSRLAKYTRDADRLDRLFRRSGLYRPKWERADYRGRTLARALGGGPRDAGGSTPPTVEDSLGGVRESGGDGDG